MEMTVSKIFGTMEFSKPKNYDEERWLEQRVNKGELDRIDTRVWREK